MICYRCYRLFCIFSTRESVYSTFIFICAKYTRIY
nr:MAG TPA: hypothetical protein [Caudoviricetes sp.]